MEQNYLARAAKYITAFKKRKRWQKIVSFLGAAVVFCTVYALILPAIAMTRTALCGKEEHQHTEACYVQAQPLSAQLPEQLCTVESIYAGLAAEEHASFVLHNHNEFCFRDGQLICTLPEIYAHTHTDACYTLGEPKLICGQEEIPVPPEEITTGHVHTDDCYENVLVCGQEEVLAAPGHQHTESCYTVELSPGELTCTETAEDHIHNEGCYAVVETPVLTCGQEETPGAAGHIHTESCYQRQLVCGQEESAAIPEVTPGHVHTEACYQAERILTCAEPALHEHDSTCYDESGALICGQLVARNHIHTAECFPAAETPVEPEQVPMCGLEEHVHDDSCYEPAVPEGPSREEQEEQWRAIFWSNVVSESSDVVLDAQTSGIWTDTSAMDPAYLEQLRNSAGIDLTRFLDSNIGIQVDSQIYNADIHGPMDLSAEFSILLKWNLSGVNFSADIFDPTSSGTLTYTYQFPQEVVVENVEKRALNDAASGQPALTYSIADNMLTVTYYAPAESVTTSFSLRASWAEGVEESAHVQWSNSAFSDVTFAKPVIAVEKTMGEDGLRVSEDGAVWADYTVTVTNDGQAAAKDVTLTDTLEAEHFHFYQGGYADGAADYAVTGADGVEQYEVFPAYGGNTLEFPAFDLAAGESRVFQYKAQMSAADREAVDASIKATAAPDPILGIQTGETVSNTATAKCGDLEVTSKSQATYGGPDSKHVEGFTQTYSADTFDVTFEVNGDAVLPAGMTAEKLEATSGSGLELDVKPLAESDEAYQTFAQYVEGEEGEETDENQLLELTVLNLELRYNGVKLDLADCDVKATITPNESLKNYHVPKAATANLTDEAEEEIEVLGETGYGIELAAFSLEKTTTTDVFAGEMTTVEPVEEGTVYLDISEDGEPVEDADTDVEPVTFSVKNGEMAVYTGAKPYPTFKVDFYAKLDRLKFVDQQSSDLTNNKYASVIDTSGGSLPKNGTTPVVRYAQLYYGTVLDALTTDGSAEDLEKLKAEKKYTLVTEEKTTRIFKQKEVGFNPDKELNLGMFNVLEQLEQKNNPNTDGTTNYDLCGFVVTEKNQTAPTYDTNGVLQLPEGVEVTDIPEGKSASNYIRTNIEDPEERGELPKGKEWIYIPDGATVTLVFTPTTSESPTLQSALFYDYDISNGLIYKKFEDGKLSEPANVSQQTDDTKWYTDIGKQGINSAENYTGNGAHLGFGNGSMYFGWEADKLNNYLINSANNANGYKTFYTAEGETCPQNEVQNGASFGIAVGYENSKIKYAEGVAAPNLFNDGTATGKSSAYQYTLEFVRQGDTYALQAVQGTSAQNLHKLEHVYAEDNTWWSTNQVISNEFWPLDGVETHGTDRHDLKFGKIALKDNRRMVGIDGTDRSTLAADFDKDHNAYFGMQFDMAFTIPEDYVGPLDYTFFGDDDLWLFLESPDDPGNGKLICDIGGVHTSVGEYVNLWDYIPKDAEGNYKAGTYKMHLYYTERGASGSTCWMQYTLPGVRSLTVEPPPEDNSGTLRIEKEVTNGTAADMDTEFSFEVSLTGTENLTGTTYDCIAYRMDGSYFIDKVTVNGEAAMIPLKATEYARIEGLAPGITYTVKEVDLTNAYKAEIYSTDTVAKVNAKEKTVTGTVEENTAVTVTYTNTPNYNLPETGGLGTSNQIWYTYGALPLMAGAILVYKKSRKKGGTVA